MKTLQDFSPYNEL